MSNPTSIDISIPVRPGIAVWPGDVEYAINLESNDSGLSLGAVTMSLHTGTHVDAPYHFAPQGQTAADLPLDPFVGPAMVIDVSGKERIRVRDLEKNVPLAPRVLLRTGAWSDHSKFPDSVPVIESYVPAFLCERGVILLGVDVPSVDSIDSKDLPNHHALESRGIRILESLDLSSAEPGEYDLIALPLRLAGADASPCRAILVKR